MLQPYLSIDALAITMLTPEQIRLMKDIAKDYPAIISRLDSKHLIDRDVATKNSESANSIIHINHLIKINIMLHEAILKFRSSGPILLPAIIDNYWLGEIKTYEDYAVLLMKYTNLSLSKRFWTCLR